MTTKRGMRKAPSRPPEFDIPEEKNQLTVPVVVSRRRDDVTGGTAGTGMTERWSGTPGPQGPGIICSVYDPSGIERNAFDTRIYEIERDVRTALARAPKDCDLRPYEDMGWYATEILRLIEVVRRMVAGGRAAGAAAEALGIGALYEEAVTKFRWEQSAIVGKRRREAQADRGKRSAASRTAAVAERDRLLFEKAEEIRMKKPGISERSIAAILKKRGDAPKELSEDRVRKIINRC